MVRQWAHDAGLFGFMVNRARRSKLIPSRPPLLDSICVHLPYELTPTRFVLDWRQKCRHQFILYRKIKLDCTLVVICSEMRFFQSCTPLSFIKLRVYNYVISEIAQMRLSMLHQASVSCS